MNRFALWLANRLARLLEPADRDALLGDQSEIGMPGVRAAREAFGLLARRKLQLLRKEPRWWHLIPVCAVLGSQGIRFAGLMEGESLRWILRPDNLITCVVVIVILLSWASGYLFQRLSSPGSRANVRAAIAAIWLTPIALEAALRGLTPSTLLIYAATHVLPLIAGMLRGGYKRAVPVSIAAALTAVPPLIIVWLISIAQSGASGDGSMGSTRTFVGVVLLITAYPGALLLWLSRRKRPANPSPNSETAS